MTKRENYRAVEKLKLLNEALGATKKNVARLQERHHVVLKKICSYTLLTPSSKKLWLKLEQPLMLL
ncbi:BnaC05g13460D [Brassica napus]|uniref:BnaC05g13460D protein n=1 Tax=Brassica napus TaxID=3708 RepID=A0A078IEM4_BRANA|nr:BnaC05g13460D [Brassica napus]